MEFGHENNFPIDSHNTQQVRFFLQLKEKPSYDQHIDFTYGAD